MAECFIRTDTKQFWFAIFMNNLQNIYFNQKQCIGISGYMLYTGNNIYYTCSVIYIYIYISVVLINHNYN